MLRSQCVPWDLTCGHQFEPSTVGEVAKHQAFSRRQRPFLAPSPGHEPLPLPNLEAG